MALTSLYLFPGTLFIAFSTIGMQESQWGYPIVDFMFMYLLGAYLKKGSASLMICGDGS